MNFQMMQRLVEQQKKDDQILQQNKRALNSLPLSPSAKKAITDLFALTDNNPTQGSERCVYLGPHQQKARAAGLTLHREGGEDLMLKVLNAVPKDDQGELSCAWDGIGGWRW